MKQLSINLALLLSFACSPVLILFNNGCATTSAMSPAETSQSLATTSQTTTARNGNESTAEIPETGSITPAATLPTLIYDSVSKYLQIGEPEQALKQVEQALKDNPAEKGIGLLYARLLLFSGRTEEARKQLNLLVAREPDDPDVLYSFSVLAGCEHKIAEQKALLEKILTKAPGHTDTLTSLGELNLKEKNVAQARDHFSRALQTDPENIIAEMGLGHIALDAGDYKSAIQAFGQVLAKKPAYAFAYIDRAEAYRQQGNFQSAIADYSCAVELEPEYYWNYIDRGKLHLLTGNKKQAQADFTKAVSIKNDYFLPHVYLAGLFYEQGEWIKALTHYQRVEELRPDYHYIYKPMAIIQYEAKNWNETARLFIKAYQYDRQEHSYPLLAALAYKKAGIEAQAVSYLTDILKKIPDTCWQYTVAKYLIRPEHEIPILKLIKQEESPLLKKIIVFYLATQYLLLGRTQAAEKYFIETTTIEQKDITEQWLASWELKCLSSGEISLETGTMDR